MAWSFNPFTGNLDLTGSSGAVVFEGEVETFADLPEVVGDPPVGSSYLVRTSTGVWLVNKRQSGIWIRRNNTGVRATDWEYGGDYPVNSVAGKTGNVTLTNSDISGLGSAATADLNAISDADLRIVGSTDATKKVAIEVDTNVPTGQTVTLTAPSSSGTLALAGDAPSAHAASHATGGTDAIAPNNISASWAEVVSSQTLFANTTLSAGRNRRITITTFGSLTITLPTTSENGDILTLVAGNLSGGTLTIQTSLPIGLATMTTAGQSYTFVSSGSGTWTLRNVNTHTHAAADVTSGVFDNARINFAAPSAIGSTTAAAITGTTGTFSTLSANNGTITASAPALDLSQTWNNSGVTFTGFRFNVTNTNSSALSLFADFQVGGTTQFSVRRDGLIFARNRIEIQNTTIGFQTSAAANGASPVRYASDTNGLGQIYTSGNVVELLGITTTSPQTFRLYNTYTDASNYERGFMRWSSNVLQIGTEKLGTGSARNVELQRDGTTVVTLGGSGEFRLTSTGQLAFASRGAILMSADGVMWLSNNAGTDFGRLAFGGTSSSFPALKRSSTTLQVRLADDSAFAPLISSQIGINVATPERPFHASGTDMWARFDRVGGTGPAIMLVRQATLGNTNSVWLFGAPNTAGVSNEDFSIVDYGVNISGTVGTPRITIAKSDGQLTVNGNLNLSTKDLVTDTTTGTKIGTGTTQKLGFFNATPIVRPAAIADATDAATTQARLNDLLAAMRSLGLIAT